MDSGATNAPSAGWNWSGRRQPTTGRIHWISSSRPRSLQPNTNTKIRFTIQDPDGNRVRRLETLHERLLHLFVVSYDLEFFTHVHPIIRADGSLDVDIVLPRPGPYRLIADFLPTGGPPQLIEKSIITGGYDGPLVPPSRASTDLEDKVANGTRVRIFSPPSFAGREQLVTFELSDNVTGKPVVDLEPYLAATGHLFVIGADLDRAFHSHPVAEVSSRFGPEVVFQMIFGREGLYRLWFQFQRNGQVATVSFTLPVSPAQRRSASSNVARQSGAVESILKRPPAEMETGLRSRSMGR